MKKIVFILIGILITQLFVYQHFFTKPQAPAARFLKECSAKKEWDLCYAKNFYNLAKKTPLNDTLNELKKVKNEDSKVWNCHLIAHYIGSVEVEKNPDQWRNVLSNIDTSCGGGFIYGVLEAHQQLDDPKFKIDENSIAKLCSLVKEEHSDLKDSRCATLLLFSKHTVSSQQAAKSLPDEPTNLYSAAPNCISDRFDCVIDWLSSITKESGPQSSLSNLSKALREDRVSTAIDIHGLAHRVGMLTAKTFGITKQAYFLCPQIGYYGGCQHGFIEYAIASTKSGSKIEKDICEYLVKQNYPQMAIFNCFHGLGHGMLMLAEHDMTQALTSCNKIKYVKGREWCWTGIFNEASEDLDVKSLSEGEFFDICPSLGHQYDAQCFEQLEGPSIMTLFGNLENAAHACVAQQSVIKRCAVLIGSFAAYNTHGDYENKGTFDYIAKVCSEFTKNLDDCYGGAVQRLVLNESESDMVSAAAEFCIKISDTSNCYSKIGETIGFQINDPNRLENLCGELPNGASESCLKGAKNLKKLVKI